MKLFIAIAFMSLLVSVNAARALHDDCVSLDLAVPTDVATFKHKRCLCYHFVGEEGYDENRREFLCAKIKEACNGLKDLLRSLKEKYSSRSDIMKVLEEIDESVLDEVKCHIKVPVS